MSVPIAAAPAEIMPVVTSSDESLETLRPTPDAFAGSPPAADAAAAPLIPSSPEVAPPDGAATPPVEGTDAPPPEPDTPLTALEVPHFRPDQPPLKLEGVPQEFADAIRKQINQAAAVPRLEAQLARSDQAVATLTMLEQQPAQALHLVGQAHPDAAAAYVKEWAQMNSGALLQMVEELGLATLDERAAGWMAENARLRSQESSRTAREQFGRQTVEQTFIRNGDRVVSDLAATLNLPANSVHAKVFQQMANDALATMYQSAPTATADQMTLHLQKLVQDFTTLTAGAPTGKSFTLGQPRDPKTGQFVPPQAAKAATLAKVASGAPALTPLQGWTDTSDTASLEDLAPRH
jgi:hypothetical protein